MKKIVIIVVLALTFSFAAFGDEPIRALIIDTGSDLTHPALESLAYPNAAELSGKPNVDDDENGYIDDIFGWNFVDNNNTLVNLANTPPNYQKVLECLRLIGILQAYGKDGMTPDEFKSLYSAYQDKKFWPWVEFTGGWAHGTHCAGILSTDNPDVKLNAVRHIRTGQAPENVARECVVQIKHMLLHDGSSARTPEAGDSPTPPPNKKFTMDELETLFSELSKDYIAKAAKETAYIKTLSPRVINCSFGLENKNLLEAFRQNMVEEWGWENPTDQEVQQCVNLFVSKALLPRDKSFLGQCENALVCIAAGNSSENLDRIVTSPNDVDISNKLLVAATQEDKKLAAFSCFGKEKVDVAVQGVNIYATFPNGEMGFLSGTSMACPMAARFATEVLQAHDRLTPVELKRILIETVDKKDWLADKVKSGGIINPNRAKFAATLVKQGKSLTEAIAEARKTVADVVIRAPGSKGPDLTDKKVRELYFSAIF